MRPLLQQACGSGHGSPRLMRSTDTCGQFHWEAAVACEVTHSDVLREHARLQYVLCNTNISIKLHQHLCCAVVMCSSLCSRCHCNVQTLSWEPFFSAALCNREKEWIAAVAVNDRAGKPTVICVKGTSHRAECGSLYAAAVFHSQAHCHLILARLTDRLTPLCVQPVRLPLSHLRGPRTPVQSVPLLTST